MNTEKDGGQAFAQYRTDPWGNPVIENGMTLRDYFAAKALTGLISSAESAIKSAVYAQAAYAIADAMLAERAK